MKHILLVGTELQGIDLSSSDIEGIVVRLENLKGVIVHSDQLVYFAGFLGIKIKK
ncbi:MAG: pentapeptide repeat-containing protein, partial [Tissierellia bacterium]|nr:pentapeptide repeat-containing protein [Tissierellia bacterium]